MLGDYGRTGQPVNTTTTEFLETAGGRLAYDDTGGDGPLVICTPGLGDLRGEYRFVVPALAAAGRRVATMDLRGHGESSTGWNDHSPQAVGADVLALVRHLDAGPAVLIGESVTAASAIWAAAEAPELVTALVLSGPFARDLPLSPVQRAAVPLLGRFVPLWTAYWSSLMPSAKPSDFAAYRAALAANLREPGRRAALRTMLAASKAACSARAEQVRCPALVVMGGKDRDFKDPAAEAAHVAGMVRGSVTVIEDAGHYPQVEYPRAFVAAVEEFLAGTGAGSA